jgi:hypothetical protein
LYWRENSPLACRKQRSTNSLQFSVGEYRMFQVYQFAARLACYLNLHVELVAEIGKLIR